MTAASLGCIVKPRRLGDLKLQACSGASLPVLESIRTHCIHDARVGEGINICVSMWVWTPNSGTKRLNHVPSRQENIFPPTLAWNFLYLHLFSDLGCSDDPKWNLGVGGNDLWAQDFQTSFPRVWKRNLAVRKTSQGSLHRGGRRGLVSEVGRLEDWPCFLNC